MKLNFRDKFNLKNETVLIEFSRKEKIAFWSNFLELIF